MSKEEKLVRQRLENSISELRKTANKLDDLLIPFTSVDRNKDLYTQDLYIAGGAITSFAINEPIKDFDFFCNAPNTAAAFRRFFLELGEGKHGNLHIKSITDRALSFTHVDDENYPYFQIITEWFGPPSVVVGGFDFVHCMAHFDQKYILAQEGFVETCAYKILRRNPNKAATEMNLGRLNKFLKRGWHMEDEKDEGLKALRKLSENEKEKQTIFSES